MHVHEVRSVRVGSRLEQRGSHACRRDTAGAHGRALTTAGCGVRAFGFSSSSDSSSELSSLLGGSMPAVAGCADTHAAT